MNAPEQLRFFRFPEDSSIAARRAAVFAAF